jgi:hypothetical protein
MPRDRPRKSDRRTTLSGFSAGALALMLGGCGSGAAQPVPPQSGSSNRIRTWQMGFSHMPPRPTVRAAVEGINLWSTRSDRAIIHEELPWGDLLNGVSPETILKRDRLELVKYLRSKGLALTAMLDLSNGLGRETESPALVKAGRSLSEPAVQALARDYALAFEAMLRPDWLGLAAETNLVRQIAPPKLYGAVRDTANLIERALAATNAKAQRFISVQAEAAWGRMLTTGAYVGIAQDLADFAFTRALGISSYPYFGHADPAGIPANYYTRLRGKTGLPVIVTEGGWVSKSFGPIKSSTQHQARYIARHADLLDSVDAIGWFQLQFAELDLTAFPGPLPDILPLFTSIALTDSDFRAKPALAQWDAQFARRWVSKLS